MGIYEYLIDWGTARIMAHFFCWNQGSPQKSCPIDGHNVCITFLKHVEFVEKSKIGVVFSDQNYT